MKLLIWCNLLESRSLESFEKEVLKIMNKEETNLLEDRIKELSNEKETIELYKEKKKVLKNYNQGQKAKFKWDIF